MCPARVCLSPSPTACSPSVQLLIYGMTPFQILIALQKQAAPAGMSNSSVPLRRRTLATLTDIQNISKQLRHESSIHPNDVAAVASLVLLLITC